MYTRLAFSVAAHLEPEILLVDEVLAVGDAAFQKKCLGKMGEVAHEGRTVLFVSHNLGQMRTLCPYALWIDGGKVAAGGACAAIAVAYERDLTKPQADPPVKKANRSCGFLSWRLITDSPDAQRVVIENEPLTVEFTFRLLEGSFYADIEIFIQSPDGQTLGGWKLSGARVKQGTYKLVCNFSQLPLRPGIYFWYASIWDGGRKVDTTRLLPDLAIATPDYSGLPPARSGVINIACQRHIEPIHEAAIVHEDAMELSP
jgi:lipopolysaccharide transport system ATP-binding protein